MTQPPPPRTILIAGPTASGKSGLALAIAEQLGGVVINADSMQVYRELRILSARPAFDAMARCPHALYGFVSGAEAYSAGRYGVDAAAAIASARAANRVPVIVGGTGLYFKVLCEGLSPVPAIPEPVRSFWRTEAADRPASELHALLAARDAQMAGRLAPTDRQRVVRALEVLEGTGRSLADWQRRPGRPVLCAEHATRLLLVADHEELKRAIDTRFEAMIDNGALDEVRNLLALGFSDALPIMRALGVAPLARHLRGQLALPDALAAAKSETQRYAKRQRTWLRRNMCAWKAIDTQQMERILAGNVSFIDY
jgi:tRNA dimethylallyltransferase